MEEIKQMDKYQLGQLIRFKAHSVDVAMRVRQPDLQAKDADHEELQKYLISWKDHKLPVTSDIQWAERCYTRYEKWRKDPKIVKNDIDNDWAPPKAVGLEALIKSRRTVRFWKKKAVSEALIKRMLEAGTYAPSAFNRLPWRFFVAETPPEELGEGDASNPGMFASAPVRIFVAADERLFFEKYSGGLDVGLAMQNMLLTAHALGLGTCLIYQGEFVDPKLLEKYYQIPTYCTVYCAILVGYPDEDPEVPARMPVEGVTTFLGKVSNPEF